MYLELSQRRLSKTQKCTVYDKNNPRGLKLNYNSSDFNSDHFCYFNYKKSDSDQGQISPDQIQISIPTLGLRPYIVDFIKNVVNVIKSDFYSEDRSILPSIVVLSNGTEERPILKSFVEEFISTKNPTVETTLICTNVAGKSNAVNILHQHAVKQSAKIMICIDDDVLLPQNALNSLYRELLDGSPKFIGLTSIPDKSNILKPIERDIFNMTRAKRRSMGWPAPIGRINALPVSLYPTITCMDMYDDVFLSAFFFINKVPQYVLKEPAVLYPTSSSLYEFIKRKRRIKKSDITIIEALPKEYQQKYFEYAISPKVSETLSKEDKSWLKISDLLLKYAENIDLFSDSKVSLDETDLSSKRGFQESFTSKCDKILMDELSRLKEIYDLDS